MIDSAKCIGYGVPFEGNVWDIYMGKAEPKEMTRKCSRDNTITCGALKVLQAPDMEAIYKMARG